MRNTLPAFPILAVTVLLLAISSRQATAAAATAALDVERPRWSALEFDAAKFLFSASTRIEVRRLPAAAIGAGLRTTPQGHPVAAPETVMEVTYASRGPGHESFTRLWIDPADGAALQRMLSDRGSRLRERTYRFTDIGAWHYTRWPATRSEEKLPPQQWTRIEDGLRPYPQAAAGQRVTETSALLWMIAAADLSRPGDRFETLTFSHRSVSRVSIEVTGQRRVSVGYREHPAEHSAGKARLRGDTVDALVLRLGAVRIDDPTDTEDFELLGLRGDLELLLDPETRAVLELHGRAKIVGGITVRLTELVLR